MRCGISVRRCAVVVLLSLAWFCPPSRAADIVFDPTNFGVNVEQVLHHLQVIARLEQQIRNQFRMLENWQFTRLDELLASMQLIRVSMHEAGALELTSRYPIAPREYAKRDGQAMRDLQRQWLESQRVALIHAQTLQNRAVSEIPATQLRIGEYVERSNAAPGQTAVLQASNETLATLAAQLQTLQSLDISQTRIELEEDAHRQAQAAFQRQRRSALMKDWPTVTGISKSPAPVPSPFSHSASR